VLPAATAGDATGASVRRALRGAQGWIEAIGEGTTRRPRDEYQGVSNK